jgi:hypothetical protein
MTEPEPTAGQPASPLAPPGIDTTVAHPARMLNYVLGGTANFPASRIAYVDNGPLVLVHARTLLPSRPEGRVSYSQTRTWSPATVRSPASRDEPHRP